MTGEKNSLPGSFRATKPPTAIVRAFGRLKVRQKLAILHNIFFLRAGDFGICFADTAVLAAFGVDAGARIPAVFADVFSGLLEPPSGGKSESDIYRLPGRLGSRFSIVPKELLLHLEAGRGAHGELRLRCCIG